MIGYCPVKRNFSIVGTHKRKLTTSRAQVPLSVGIISSVHRAQGETIAKVVMDPRKPVDGNMGIAAVYVASSRATDASRLFLLSPVSLEDFTHPQDADVAAQIDYLERLDEATLASFLDDPLTFRPARPTLIAGPLRTISYDPLPSLSPNESSNCFFNAAMAVWDDCPLPDPSLSMSQQGPPSSLPGQPFVPTCSTALHYRTRLVSCLDVSDIID